MRLRQLITEDDAVSPVIGVILMVAITVILAAVIGAFVLGFGGGGPSAPTASWDTTESNSSNTVTFTAQSVSDTFNSSTLSVGGAEIANDQLVNANTQIVVNLTTSGSDNLQQGDTIELIWSKGGSSSTIASHTLSMGGGPYGVENANVE